VIRGEYDRALKKKKFLIMKISKIFLSAALLLLLSGVAISQDIRLLETKVADLLAQFPAKDTQYTD